MVFYYFFSPANAYDVNIKIEEHAFETYSKYLIDNPNDQKIKEIAQMNLIMSKNLTKLCQCLLKFRLVLRNLLAILRV